MATRRPAPTSCAEAVSASPRAICSHRRRSGRRHRLDDRGAAVRRRPVPDLRCGPRRLWYRPVPRWTSTASPSRFSWITSRSSTLKPSWPSRDAFESIMKSSPSSGGSGILPPVGRDDAESRRSWKIRERHEAAQPRDRHEARLCSVLARRLTIARTPRLGAARWRAAPREGSPTRTTLRVVLDRCTRRRRQTQSIGSMCSPTRPPPDRANRGTRRP